MSDRTATACAPVLVIAYNRPDLVVQVMEVIARARPDRVFLACDGPNPDRADDEALVAATRSAMESAITWSCTIERLYRERNVGCRLGVSGAIDWFFSQVEEGIILEDDCVPHVDFFRYCSALLERYREDRRVMHISGDGAVSAPSRRRPESYVFTTETLVWGWATWSRAWGTYDRDLARWASVRSSPRELRRVFSSPSVAAHWTRRLDRLLFEGAPDTWDYQWSFTVMEQGGVATVPTTNLVTNVGHRSDGTHTTASGGRRADAASAPLGEIRHPRSMRVRRRLNRAIEDEVRGLSREKDRWRHRVRKATVTAWRTFRSAVVRVLRGLRGRI